MGYYNGGADWSSCNERQLKRSVIDVIGVSYIRFWEWYGMHWLGEIIVKENL